MERRDPDDVEMALIVHGAADASVEEFYAIYRLGDDLVVRLPRIADAVEQVEFEDLWLPRLAPLLPSVVPEPIALGQPEARYTLFHHGRGQMIDHMLVTRNLLAHYRGSEIHNEILHDDTIAFATDDKYPESDHAPVVATFDFD
ncbi:phosphotransferase [Streptomyces bicolor]|uniref:phosphotransferase n=1 Tax=Streptomyces bicolor TaxID=66874 RepID=UPI0004E2730A|nr:phosphotransferase [Streptomyces bicolor]